MKKAVVFLADGCEMVEALTPVDLLRRAGVEVVTLSINGTDMVKSSHNVQIQADAVFTPEAAEHADIAILPGGMPGTLHLGQHEGVAAAVRRLYEEGKYVAAICAAPSVLGQMGLLNGKKAVCYPSFEDKLTGAEVLQEEVVVDGQVITSRGMGTAIPFGLAIIKELLGEEQAQNVRESIIFRMDSVK